MSISSIRLKQYITSVYLSLLLFGRSDPKRIRIVCLACAVRTQNYFTPDRDIVLMASATVQPMYSSDSGLLWFMPLIAVFVTTDLSPAEQAERLFGRPITQLRRSYKIVLSVLVFHQGSWHRSSLSSANTRSSRVTSSAGNTEVKFLMYSLCLKLFIFFFFVKGANNLFVMGKHKIKLKKINSVIKKSLFCAFFELANCWNR